MRASPCHLLVPLCVFCHLPIERDVERTQSLNITVTPDRVTGKRRKAYTGAYAYLPNYFVRSLTQQCVPRAGANTCARDNVGTQTYTASWLL